ncbi:unnamed protein product [Toxocara canis]|uniref:RVT_N domain-containing protein n=1 Tax=Toxocara canis TaxID=6265 RepID=A0A183UEQ9_TOXCA|nr:unnamed protein product [Toxocara canis]
MGSQDRQQWTSIEGRLQARIESDAFRVILNAEKRQLRKVETFVGSAGGASGKDLSVSQTFFILRRLLNMS